MYDDISVEQRAHDLALIATENHLRLTGEDIDEKNAFEYAIYYRSILRNIRRSIEEGRTDLL